MKTLMNQVVSAERNAGITLLDWSGEATSSRFGQRLGGLRIARQIKDPALRIVRPANEDLFQYAIGMKVRSGFWEAIVFVALGVSAVGALAMAFLGV